MSTAMMVGCGSTPRVDLEASRAVGDAVGLKEPVEFRVVGPDGGQLDEPTLASSTLTLEEAVKRAVTTAPELQSALARVRVAMADADQSRLLPNPIVSIAVRWGPGKPQIEASLVQDVVQALQIPRRSSAADNRLRLVAADAITVALDIASDMHERYLALQASSSLLSLLDQRKTLLDQLAGVAKSKLDAGEGTRSDLVTLQAQLVELQVEMDQITLTDRENRTRLARRIGEPSSAAAWQLEPWNAPSVQLTPEALWIETGLSRRPEIQAIAWKMKALGDDEALAKFFPWEGASAGVEIQRDDKLFSGPSISTPIPVFDTGQAQKARVNAEQLEARHDLTLARRKIVEEVRVAHQISTASIGNLARIRAELIPLQQHRRSIAEAAYRSGENDVTSLFLAEQDLRLAQAKAIEIELQAATALVRLHRAVGGAGVAAGISNASSTEPDPLPTSHAR